MIAIGKLINRTDKIEAMPTHTHTCTWSILVYMVSVWGIAPVLLVQAIAKQGPTIILSYLTLFSDNPNSTHTPRTLQDFILEYDSMIEIIRHTCNQPANASGRSDVTKPNGCQGDGNPVQRIWDGVKPYLAIVTQWVHCFLLRKVNSGCKQNHHRGKDNKYDYQITSNELKCGLL